MLRTARLPISSAANPILRTHGASALSAPKKPKLFRPACLQEITQTESMLLRDISPEERDTFMRIGLKMLSNFSKNH